MPACRTAFLSAAGILLLHCSAAMGTDAEPFPEDSPEHQALMAARPFLGDETFSLRRDYWRGTPTTATGSALRLQFFKGNTYRLFFGVAPSTLPKGATLHLSVYNAANEEVSKVSSEPGEAALALHFKNNLGTGLYLILMRVEAPPGPITEMEVPAVLFYGWR